MKDISHTLVPSNSHHLFRSLEENKIEMEFHNKIHNHFGGLLFHVDCQTGNTNMSEHEQITPCQELVMHGMR